MTEATRFEPDYEVSAGQHLQTVLMSIGMSQSDLAARTGISPKHINQLIKKNLPISPETATQLEYATSVPARIWVGLDAQFQAFQARERSSARLADALDWLDQFNLKELAKREVIPDQSRSVTTIEALLKFFGIADPDGWNRVWLPSIASFRKSPAFVPDRSATTVWLRAAQRTAQLIETAPYDQRRLNEAAAQLRAVTRLDPDEGLTRAQEVLAAAGVALVFVAEFERCHASGATWWASPSKAVIVLSNRGKREDRLWFSLFHEIGHILLHAKRDTFIDSNVGGSAEEDGPPWSSPVPVSGFIDDGSRDSIVEQEADDYAGETLIPARFQRSVASLRSARDVKVLAEEIGICAGIVAGRYQYEKQAYRKFNDLRREIPHERFVVPLE